MKDFEIEFLEVLLATSALKFGSFKTKSGRVSPFFINTGCFDEGGVMRRVASCYAQKIMSLQAEEATDIHLYGPAYKGIPLVTSVSMALSSRLEESKSSRKVFFTFNRKEAKDHGEGGLLVGHPIDSSSRLIITEDVLTGGTSVRETLKILASQMPQIKYLLVGVDREEKGVGQRLAREELMEDFGIPTVSILTITKIIDHLSKWKVLGQYWLTRENIVQIMKYRQQYG